MRRYKTARQNWVVSQREWVAENLHSLTEKISPARRARWRELIGTCVSTALSLR